MMLFFTFVINAQIPWEKLDKNQPCVGYSTKKGMFVFATVEVVGIQCGLNIVYDSNTKEASVKIPVTNFNSDHSTRDEHVSEILGGEKKDPLEFKATVDSSWIAEKKNTLKGSLTIKNLVHEVEFTAIHKESIIELTLKTSFSALGIEVPSVALGLVAAPKDELILFGQIPNKSVSIH